MITVLRFPILVGACFFAISTGAAHAQANSEGEQTNKRSVNRLLEEVVVTAQKREEDSQEIPISVAAYSAEKLDAFGIDKVEDLGRITPGLTFTSNVGYTVVYLRGVGADAFLPAADLSVTTYIDGVSKISGIGVQSSLGPIERVEVLKGPQGTLFGRNSTGGAISVITVSPPSEFAGYVQVERGENGIAKDNLYIGAPITDKIAFSLSGFNNTHDPYFQNETPGQDPDPVDSFSEGGRLKVRWDALDNLQVTIIGYYQDQMDPSSMIQENTRPAPVLAAGREPDVQDRRYQNNVQAGTASRAHGGDLIVEWQLPLFDTKTIFSDQMLDIYFAQLDYDTSGDNAVSFISESQYGKQQTAEVQFLSNDGSWKSEKLEWVAGLYYLKGLGGFDDLDLTVAPAGLVSTGLFGSLSDVFQEFLNTLGPEQKLRTGGVLKTESFSAYFQTSWSFSESFIGTFGGRYQRERRDILKSRLETINPDSLLQTFNVPTIIDENFAPRFAFSWFPNDYMQVYASAARGFKSPTYNTVNFFSEPDPVDREEATTYELGIKSDLLDGALRLNGALFQANIKDLLTAELSITSGGVVRFDNAGEGEIKGAEMDFLWQPMPNWNPGLALSGNMTYLDAEYIDYPNGSGFDDDSGLAFGPTSQTGDTSRDFKGNKIIRTPEFSSSVSVNQSINIGNDSAIEFGLDYFYSGEYFTSPQNSEFYVQDQYELWNGRISYFYDPWGLQVTAFGVNMKDKEYFASIQAQDFGRATTLAAPGYFGLRVKWDFGQTFAF